MKNLKASLKSLILLSLIYFISCNDSNIFPELQSINLNEYEEFIGDQQLIEPFLGFIDRTENPDSSWALYLAKCDGLYTYHDVMPYTHAVSYSNILISADSNFSNSVALVADQSFKNISAHTENCSELFGNLVYIQATSLDSSTYNFHFYSPEKIEFSGNFAITRDSLLTRSISSNLDINWTADYSNYKGVLITLEYLYGDDLKEMTNPPTDPIIKHIITADDGSYTISSTLLEGFPVTVTNPNIQLHITLMRGVYLTPIVEGLYFPISIYSSIDRSIILTL